MKLRSIYRKRSPKRSHLLMPIDDVMPTGTPGKIVVLGIISQGEINPGDALFLRAFDFSIPVIVETLEANQRLLQRAIAGERVTVLLTGPDSTVVSYKRSGLHLASFGLPNRSPEVTIGDFKLALGVSVSDLSGIGEGYSLQQTGRGYAVLTINISADRLEDTFLRLASLIRTPGFAIVEVPTHGHIEDQLRKRVTDPFHWDVYHLSGLEYARFKGLFLERSQFLVDDGLVNFGFGSQIGIDEVFVGRYKVTYVYSDEPQKYREALESLGYERKEPLKTVFANFTADTPGRTATEPIGGKTIGDQIQELVTDEGFHLAERKAEE